MVVTVCGMVAVR